MNNCPNHPNNNCPRRTSNDFSAYVGKLEDQTLNNNDYRHVIYTDPLFQLVLMSLLPLQEIGTEIHEDTTQFFRIEEGHALVVLNNSDSYYLSPGDALVVPFGTVHNVINISTTEKLKIYTIYTPAHHPANTIEKMKK
jgi:mannose-6-phosphate isomerase-like protein (cupin superfamily)